MIKPEIQTILKLLKDRYGKRKLEPHHDPLGEMIQTILSQNTSDINSRPSFKALQAHYSNWESILAADIDVIARLISRGGLGKIKAQRIQRSLLEIRRQRGNLNLDFLDNIPVPEARDWLKQLPGVGNKTANCVLLFALGKPALPVDTHVFRLAKRLGLIKGNSNLEEAHQFLESIIAPEDIYEFHVMMIEHGRRTCIARRPRCPECVLKTVCPGYNKFNDHQ